MNTKRLGLAGWLTLAALLLAAASKTALWLWPYNRDGMISEAVLTVLAFALAAAVAWHWGKGRRWWVYGAALLYAAGSMSWLGWSAQQGLGFGVNKHYVFSTPACEFAAIFEAPPQISAIGLGTGRMLAADAVASWADITTVTAFRADCLAFDPATARAAPQGVQGLVREAARNWAQSIRFKADPDGERFEGGVYRLQGRVGGSILPDEGGERQTVAAAWSYVGERSVMTVYVMQSLGQTLSPQSLAFLAGVRRR